MAENIVVKDFLTDAMIEAGAELTSSLIEAGLPLTAAMWYFDVEINEWKLLFYCRGIAETGAFPVYEKLQTVYQALGNKVAAAPFLMISLRDAKDELIVRIQEGLQVEPDSRYRLHRSVINGRYIEDALLYLLVAPPTARRA